MLTPEGLVKATVKKLLDTHKAYYLMPMQNGMGAPALDFHGIHKGKGFCVETKAPGKKPTPRQEITIKHVQLAQGVAFVVDGSDESVTRLRLWLEEV